MLPAVAVEAELAALRGAGEEHKVPVQVIWHEDKWASPALGALLETSRWALSASHPPRAVAG